MNAKKTITILLISGCLFFAFSAWAGYKLEVGIPNQTGAEKGDEISLVGYIRAIYLFALGAVGGAALLMLVASGLVYMLSDTVFSKEQAKEYIWGAISGLVLAFAAYLILNTINPDLVRIRSPKLPSSNQNGSGASETQSPSSPGVLPDNEQQPQPICGNGIIEGSEACDDGNVSNNDGCNSGCTVEAEFCGDSAWQPSGGEECDDGNKVNGDGCDNDCKVGLWVGKVQCLIDNDPPVGFKGESYQECKLSQPLATESCAKKCSVGVNGCSLIQDCKRESGVIILPSP